VDTTTGGPLGQAQLGPPGRWGRRVLWTLGMLALLWLWAEVRGGEPQRWSYSEFKERVRAGEVAGITLSGDRANGTLRSFAVNRADARGSARFVTTLPPLQDPELFDLLEAREVEMRAVSQASGKWVGVLAALLPWLIVGGLVWHVARSLGGRIARGERGAALGFARSQARRYDHDQAIVTFDDVAGLEIAKQDLRELAEYLRQPLRYLRLGAKFPKGVLLMGPPGTGKTLLARAMAGEAGVPFFSICGSEFVEMFVGVGASRVRDLFDMAKQAAPAVIFIDEIDSVGRSRGASVGGGHDEREQTLNQILGEMDGFESNDLVVVIAATNRPEVIDPALLRPGRFDRKIRLELPERKARQEILALHARCVRLASDVDLERAAALTVGFSGADLKHLVNEAALLAGRRNSNEVDMVALLGARDRVVLGSEREMVIGDDERRLIACHEAGHALAATVLPHADPLDKVTIVPRGHALGATEQVPREGRHHLREHYLRDRIGVMLGGRVAEKLIFGEASSGAEQDLKQATRLARRMVMQWGMSEAIGPVAFRRGDDAFLGGETTEARDFSERTAQLIDAEIQKLMSEIEQRVTQLLARRRPALDALTEALLEFETLEREAVDAVLRSCDARRQGAA
jgi:cell division protease FtsH